MVSFSPGAPVPLRRGSGYEKCSRSAKVVNGCEMNFMLSIHVNVRLKQGMASSIMKLTVRSRLEAVC